MSRDTLYMRMRYSGRIRIQTNTGMLCWLVTMTERFSDTKKYKKKLNVYFMGFQTSGNRR